MGILDYRIGLSDRTSKGILDSGFNLDGSEMSPQQQQEYEQFKKDNNMSSIPFRSNNLAMGMSISDAQPLSKTLGITFDTDGIRSLPFNRDFSMFDQAKIGQIGENPLLTEIDYSELDDLEAQNAGLFTPDTEKTGILKTLLSKAKDAGGNIFDKISNVEAKISLVLLTFSLVNP